MSYAVYSSRKARVGTPASIWSMGVLFLTFAAGAAAGLLVIIGAIVLAAAGITFSLLPATPKGIISIAVVLGTLSLATAGAVLVL